MRFPGWLAKLGLASVEVVGAYAGCALVGIAALLARAYPTISNVAITTCGACVVVGFWVWLVRGALLSRKRSTKTPARPLACSRTPEREGRPMNRGQQAVLWTTVAVAVGMGMFPPWRHVTNYSIGPYSERSERPAGWHYLGSLPTPEPHPSKPGPPLAGESIAIDGPRLAIQWILTGLVGATAFVWLKNASSIAGRANVRAITEEAAPEPRCSRSPRRVSRAVGVSVAALTCAAALYALHLNSALVRRTPETSPGSAFSDLQPGQVVGKFRIPGSAFSDLQPGQVLGEFGIPVTDPSDPAFGCSLIVTVVTDPSDPHSVLIRLPE
jgi:hypothetical protein